MKIKRIAPYFNERGITLQGITRIDDYIAVLSVQRVVTRRPFYLPVHFQKSPLWLYYVRAYTKSSYLSKSQSYKKADFLLQNFFDVAQKYATFSMPLFPYK